MKEYIVIQGEKVFMYIGHPKSPSSNKIDVTMAFKVGMDIGSKNYDNIESLNL